MFIKTKHSFNECNTQTVPRVIGYQSSEKQRDWNSQYVSHVWWKFAFHWGSKGLSRGLAVCGWHIEPWVSSISTIVLCFGMMMKFNF